jgi:2-dehydro-3-deoxygalactonokinase
MNAGVRLIGLDWGTSSLRAYLYDAAGKVVATRQQGWGIRQLPEGGFAAALEAITADWPACTAIAAGMVGSRQGWREVPYVALPADAASIAGGMRRVEDCRSHELWIAPGLARRQPADVMRGEETQIIGALAGRPLDGAPLHFVLPGTHSKWATVRHGRITAFDTLMTGEMYALLVKHSILGAGLPPESARPFVSEAFVRGVVCARDSGGEGIFGRLFSTRALMLAGELAPAHVSDFLSGLLIGEELRIARLRNEAPLAPLCLIGEAALCERYTLAAAQFGFAAPTIVNDAAAHGLWVLAGAGGLLARAKHHSFSGATL